MKEGNEEKNTALSGGDLMPLTPEKAVRLKSLDTVLLKLARRVL